MTSQQCDVTRKLVTNPATAPTTPAVRRSGLTASCASLGKARRMLIYNEHLRRTMNCCIYAQQTVSTSISREILYSDNKNRQPLDMLFTTQGTWSHSPNISTNSLDLRPRTDFATGVSHDQSHLTEAVRRRKPSVLAEIV